MKDYLQTYLQKFSRLRRGTTRYGPAPHKPVLLLAVIRGFEEGWLQENRIELSPELVATFKAVWRKRVATPHAPLIAQPFFYMRSEKFWHHVPNPGFEEWVKVTRNCQAIGVLHRAVAYVRLDPELYALMVSPMHRELLKETLNTTYFGGIRYEPETGLGYLELLDKQILEGSGTEYAAGIQALRDSLDPESFEEEVFVRGGMFKRQVPQAYHNACCISGLQVETSINASLLDACHIVPFSTSHDDTISNGLSLCPTLHRAFDRGLIAVDPDRFTVRVSKRLSEPVASVYSIRQFEGKELQKPFEKRWWPSPENLAKHLERFAANF
jgi:putative restriction endonuclease